MTRKNNEIADLKATSSKGLMHKFQKFEENRQKLVKERQSYGMQEVTSNNNVRDIPRNAAQNQVKESGTTTIRIKKHVPKFIASRRLSKEVELTSMGMNKTVPKLTAAPSKLKEGVVATKGMKSNNNQPQSAIGNQEELAGTQSKFKEGQPSPKRMRKPSTKKLDFSHLQNTFDTISRRVNTGPPTLGEEQFIPPQQRECSKSKDIMDATTAVKTNPVPQGEPSAAAMNNFDPIEREATDELIRKLHAIRKGKKLCNQHAYHRKGLKKDKKNLLCIVQNLLCLVRNLNHKLK